MPINGTYFDSFQYIGHLGINDVLICCIVDTGAHRTIIDSAMAAALGLKVKTEGI
jgi:predicted aspartyl protease